jgi:hypothetical protein
LEKNSRPKQANGGQTEIWKMKKGGWQGVWTMVLGIWVAIIGEYAMTEQSR